MNSPLIQFKDVYKSFDSNHVLRGVDLSIHQGEVTAIIGKSGSGKSILLKLMIGLMKPDTGEILFNNQPLLRMKSAQIDRLRAKFSYVFQDAALFDSMSVYDNIALPLRWGSAPSKSDIKNRVENVMKIFDLEQARDKYPSQISGGMKRRVALARALITDPDIVLLDEPTTGLDPIRKNALYSMIVDFQKRFTLTTVMVSHEIPDIFYFSQRIAVLDEGRIRFEGSSDEIRQVSDPMVQQFIGGLEKPHDALTGMGSLVQGERKFQEELTRLQRHQIVFSVVMLTVENMAEINVKMGHLTGQIVLRNFADQILQRLDVMDFCSRYSLDKILVVLHDADMNEARRFSNRLANELSAEDLLKNEAETDLIIRISAGYAQADADSMIKEVLEKAESKESLYFEFELQ